MQIFDDILGVINQQQNHSSETGIPSDIEDEDIQLSPVFDSVLNDESIILQVDEDTVIQSDENVTSEEVFDGNSATINFNKIPDSKKKEKANESDEKHKSNVKPPVKRKKLATRLERSLETVVGKIMDGQKEMESRYIQLEEKRWKMKMELEEKQREAERQHELKLWSMMTQWTGRGAFSYSPQTCPPGQPYSPAPLQSYYPTYDQRYDTNND